MTLRPSETVHFNNHLYFLALHALAEAGVPTRCLFLHVPADEQTHAAPTDAPAMPFVRQIETAGCILTCLRADT